MDVVTPTAQTSIVEAMSRTVAMIGTLVATMARTTVGITEEVVAINSVMAALVTSMVDNMVAMVPTRGPRLWPWCYSHSFAGCYLSNLQETWSPCKSVFLALLGS
jgi:hypothetical protein